MTDFSLPDIFDFDFQTIPDIILNSSSPALFVFSCGYEERSLAQYLELKKIIPREKINYLCFSFATYKTSGSRPKNDEILSADGIRPIEVEPKNWEQAWMCLETYFKNNMTHEPHIFIDYSSMPRNWYCMFAKKIIDLEVGKNVAMIYSHGEYFESQYPVWVTATSINFQAGQTLQALRN